jgi:type II secretory pathway component PulM
MAEERMMPLERLIANVLVGLKPRERLIAIVLVGLMVAILAATAFFLIWPELLPWYQDPGRLH